MPSKQPETKPDNALLTTDEAIEKYASAVKTEATGANYLELGAAYYIAGRWDDALRALDKAVEIDPRQEFAYYYIGILNAALGNRERADAALNKLLQVSDNQMLKDQARARILNITSLADLGKK